MTAAETPTEANPGAGSRLAFHLSRIVIDVGVLIALGAMSLPFITSPAGDRSAIDADALPALLLLIPVFLITLIPDHAWPVPKPLGWVALLLGAAAFPYALVKRLDATLLADTLDGEVGFGATLLVVGTIVVLAGIIYGLIRAAFGKQTGGSATRTARIPKGRVAPTSASGATRPGRSTATTRVDTPAVPRTKDPSDARGRIHKGTGSGTGSPSPQPSSSPATSEPRSAPAQPRPASSHRVEPITPVRSESVAPDEMSPEARGNQPRPATQQAPAERPLEQPSQRPEAQPAKERPPQPQRPDPTSASSGEPREGDAPPGTPSEAPRPRPAPPQVRRPVLDAPAATTPSHAKPSSETHAAAPASPEDVEEPSDTTEPRPSPALAETETTQAAASKRVADDDPEMVQIELELADIPDMEATGEIETGQRESDPDKT